MIPYWMSRTQLMLGDDLVLKLMGKNILVVGLGGVGGICAEMIVRAGVGKITIVDNDTIDASNINRQIPALHSTIKKSKAQVLAARLLDINPTLHLTILEAFVENDSMIALIEKETWDYVVDCIDTLSAKVDLIKGCMDRKISIVSSMGAGGKVDPSQIKVTDLSKTHECNLARYVRKRLQALGIKKGLKVVFSAEKADQSKIIETEQAYPKKSIIGTLSYMPAIFGCTVASVVIRDLMAMD
ncbi:MAG: tRNA threonylcarbamoyladenosine dehydratase [Chitinophagia bacterium]|jgi:tRNA threonylcarbamoyladenosine dehydratase